MITATKALPEGYAQSGVIDLKKNKRLIIILNIAALFVTVLGFYLLAVFATLVRPDMLNISGSITAGALVILVVVVVSFLTIHELIHGLFFWVFTRSKPVFALRLFYAYAGAPAWYIPVRQYAVITIAPLAIISALGLLLIALAPESWILIVAIVVALNTGGAVGDLYVFSRLLGMQPNCLANDTGDVMTFYVQLSTISQV